MAGGVQRRVQLTALHLSPRAEDPDDMMFAVDDLDPVSPHTKSRVAPGGGGVAEKSPKHAFTVPLNRIKSAFSSKSQPRRFHTTDKNQKFSPQSPPELALNDLSIDDSFLGATPPEEVCSNHKTLKQRLKLPSGFLSPSGDKNSSPNKCNTSNNFLRVDDPRQRLRKRSRSMDDRLPFASDPIKVSSKKKSPNLQKLALIKSNSYDPHSPKFEEVRRILENQKYSPIKKYFFATFLRAHRCYELIAVSSKLVVLDTGLPVCKAFHALLYNNVRAAPLWSSQQQRFVGMLTVTDFMRVLCQYYRETSAADLNQLASHDIATWKQMLVAHEQPLVRVTADASLYEAVTLLLDHRVHRLPVIDRRETGGNVLSVLTHKRILKFIYLSDFHQPRSFLQPIKELGVGTLDGSMVKTINRHTTIHQALQLFLKHQVSALPIVDERGVPIGIYSKSDVLALASVKEITTLDLPVSHVIGSGRPGLAACYETVRLGDAIRQIVTSEVHRLLIVHPSPPHALTGIVSLSDILQFIYDNQSPAAAANQSPAAGAEEDSTLSSVKNSSSNLSDVAFF